MRILAVAVLARSAARRLAKVVLERTFARTFALVLLHAVAIEAQPIHHGTRAERRDHRAGLIDDAEKRIGPFNARDLFEESTEVSNLILPDLCSYIFSVDRRSG